MSLSTIITKFPNSYPDYLYREDKKFSDAEFALERYNKKKSFEKFGTIKINCNEKRDQKFIKKAYNCEFPAIKRLYLYQIGNMPKSKYLDNFMCNSLNYTLRYLFISGGNWCEIGNYYIAFMKVIPIVTEEVYIDCFTLDGSTVSSIIEKAHKCERLCLVNLKVDINTLVSSNISRRFKVRTDLDFKIEHLVLDETLIQSDKESLNTDKAHLFFKGLKKSTLKTSLKKISIIKGEFNKNNLRDLLKEYGFTCEIIENQDKREPTGMNPGEKM